MKQITSTLLVGFGSLLVGIGIGYFLADESEDYILGENEEFGFDHEYTAQELADIYEDKLEIKETLEKYHEENIVKEEPETSSLPIVIDYNEFFLNPNGFSQSTLVYYEDDGVVCDERDEVINDPEKLLGEDFDEMFGKMSEDPSIVYIQNSKMRTMYEVILDNSSYKETVLGLMDDEDDYKKALKYFRLEEDSEE